MHKLYTFAKAPNAAARAALHAFALTDAAPRFLASPLAPLGLIVNPVDVDPGDAAWRRPGEPPPPDAPPWDVAVESFVAAGAAAEAARWWADALAAHAAEVASWRVEETVEKAERARRGPGRSPGVKYIALMRFHDDLPASAGRRSWAHHAPLAVRVHVGMDVYVRNWVEEALTPGAPSAQGIVELHFPTREAMRERWFASEEGRREIVQDIGHFLRAGTRMYASEHVLRPPPG